MARSLDTKFGMLAPTLASQANGEQGNDDQVEGSTNGQSRGALRPTKPRDKKPKKRPEKIRDFKAKLDEAVFDRLRLTAHKRGMNMSFLANKILDAGLPHFELKQIEKPADKTGAAE